VEEDPAAFDTAPLGLGEAVKSGFAALVGRPNSGKSTLTNALVGEKIAIVSDKPQTTRHRLRGIVDRDDAQVVLVDTPGLHRPVDTLGEEVNRSALLALADVDVVCLLVDASEPVGRGDAWVARHVAESPAPSVLVVTKTDLVEERSLAKQMHAAEELGPFDAQVAVSAIDGQGLDELLVVLSDLLPEGPRFFPRDMTTDQPLAVMIAEFIREKVLVHTREEVPHAIGVAVEDVVREEGSDTTVITAVVYVERESQKGIVVGRGGTMIKRIGTEARRDLERMLGEKVFLDLRVKVKKDWRRDAAQIRRFGYGEGL
jgi:GTP-binding protein Era